MSRVDKSTKNKKIQRD